MTPEPAIVLIHGFWVTPRSWEDWIARYEGAGHRVLAPAYPGFEVEVEALNADPTPIEKVTVPEIIEHLESVVRELDEPPILIGHSAGGVFTQILLDHGYGAAGVAINSAPTEGVKRVPLSQIRATFPVLKNPANRHRAVGFTFEQWNYAFTNGFPEEEARRLYERYHIPASGEIFWGSALANIHPGKDDNWVDYKNEERAPLLFISGSNDHLMPPSIQRSERQALERQGRDRGEGVRGAAPAARLAGLGAGRRLRARLGAAARRAVERCVRITHIGGPTALIELDGWRLLTDPTFDGPGGRYAFGWGTSSRKLAGPAIAAATSAGSTPSCSPTTTTPTTSTPRARAAAVGRAVVTTASGARRLGGHARAGGVADDPARGGRAAGDRGHGDAVPARPSAQPPAGRGRDRLRAPRDGEDRARCGSRATRCCTTGARVADRIRVDVALCISEACASRSRGRCVLDDGQGRRRAVRSCGRGRRSRSTTRAGHFQEGREAIERVRRATSTSMAADRRAGR